METKIFCSGVFVVSLLFVFFKKCNSARKYSLASVKNSVFCLFSLFCFSLFLNVATDSKDEELKAPPRRPYLGMYYWDTPPFPPCSLSLCQHLLWPHKLLHQEWPVHGMIHLTHSPASLSLEYLQPADFKGGVDPKEGRMDAENSRLQTLNLFQVMMIPKRTCYSHSLLNPSLLLYSNNTGFYLVIGAAASVTCHPWISAWTSWDCPPKRSCHLQEGIAVCFLSSLSSSPSLDGDERFVCSTLGSIEDFYLSSLPLSVFSQLPLMAEGSPLLLWAEGACFAVMDGTG